MVKMGDCPDCGYIELDIETADDNSRWALCSKCGDDLFEIVEGD
jgi:hypothetical protein